MDFFIKSLFLHFQRSRIVYGLFESLFTLFDKVIKLQITTCNSVCSLKLDSFVCFTCFSRVFSLYPIHHHQLMQMPKVGQPEIDQIGMLITAIHVLFIQIVNVRTDFGIHQMQCLMLQNISFVQKMFPFAKIKFLLMMQFFRLLPAYQMKVFVKNYARVKCN